MKSYLWTTFFLITAPCWAINLCVQPTSNHITKYQPSIPEPKLPHSSVEWRIWAYSTAAPDYISKDCTVIEHDGTVLREGHNGWTAMPANPMGKPGPEGWKNPHEAMPVVMDKQAMIWAKAFRDQQIPQLEKNGWGWMLHGDLGSDNAKPGQLKQKLSNPLVTFRHRPEGWIESGPHLMMMPKNPKSLEPMTTDFCLGEPYAMFKSTPYAHVMIPFNGYYSYQE